MAFVNVYEAKTQLSRLLRRVRSGEQIVIAAAGRPIARLVPYSSESGPRVLGGDEDVVWDAEDFNAPLPDAILDAFSGAQLGRPSESKGRKRSRGPHRKTVGRSTRRA